MAETIVAPFSVRNRGAHEQVDQDFPETARVGLLHLLHQWIELEYVRDWMAVARELQRICRERPGDYSSYTRGVAGDPAVDAERLVLQMSWQKAFDFCERLYSHLANAVGEYDDEHRWYATVKREEVQKQVGTDVSRLFLEEHLSFEFKDGLVRRRGRYHTNEKVTRADLVLGDPRLRATRNHWNKASKYFRDAKNPDPENAVKEAVCAVEAAGRALFTDQAAKTLADLVKSLTGPESGKLPKAIANTFHGL